MPKRSVLAVLAAAAIVLAAVLAAAAPLGADYSGPPSSLCDCPAAPIHALATGHLHGFLSTQPVMGSTSLLLRAPFAAAGIHLTDGTATDLYRLGAFPCLLAAGLLAIYLFARMRELRRPPLAAALLPLLVAVNPLTTKALRFGHPEEILAAALCVAAILAAARRNGLLAGVMLGAAVATKQWALLAALPVIAAAGEERARTALAALATAALLIVPMAAGDLHRFIDVNRGAGVIGGGVLPTNIWFGIGGNAPIQLLANGDNTPPRVLPHELGALTHPLIMVAGLVIALAWWRYRRDAAPEDALLLLALIMLVRCLLDPITNSYYHLPFLMALAAWEGLRRRGAPVLTVAATLLLGLTVSLANSGIDLVVLNRFYLGWTVPFALLLALLVFRPRPYHRETFSRQEVLRWAD